MREKGQEMSGMHRTGAEEKIVFRVSKVFCWDSVHDQG